MSSWDIHLIKLRHTECSSHVSNFWLHRCWWRPLFVKSVCKHVWCWWPISNVTAVAEPNIQCHQWLTIILKLSPSHCRQQNVVIDKTLFLNSYVSDFDFKIRTGLELWFPFKWTFRWVRVTLTMTKLIWLNPYDATIYPPGACKS